jgi:hypothetical protein
MAKPKAKAKAKPRPKKKSAPKKKVTLEVIFEDMKKIHKKLDDLEKEILAMRGVAMSQPHQPEEEDDDDVVVKFGFLTSL